MLLDEAAYQATSFSFTNLPRPTQGGRKDIKMYNYTPMNTKKSGFDELPHTADWAVRVWAGSLPELFVEAARAMNSLLGMKSAPGPRLIRTIHAEALDVEGLLVSFLSELVYFIELENLAFDEFELELDETRLKLRMSGSPILSMSKSIKAVTYHNLQICKKEYGFQVDIVFDV